MYFFCLAFILLYKNPARIENRQKSVMQTNAMSITAYHGRCDTIATSPSNIGTAPGVASFR